MMSRFDKNIQSIIILIFINSCIHLVVAQQNEVLLSLPEEVIEDSYDEEPEHYQQVQERPDVNRIDDRKKPTTHAFDPGVTGSPSIVEFRIGSNGEDVEGNTVTGSATQLVSFGLSIVASFVLCFLIM